MWAERERVRGGGRESVWVERGEGRLGVCILIG